MTTGYNIACALHPGLVSIPFYAIPISLSIIHKIFYLLVLIRMSNLYGVRDCQGNNIEAPVRMNELLIQGWGGTVGGEGRPLTAPRTVLGGPNIPPWTVRGDQVFCRGRSRGTNFGGDRLSRDRSTQLLLTRPLSIQRPVKLSWSNWPTHDAWY